MKKIPSHAVILYIFIALLVIFNITTLNKLSRLETNIINRFQRLENAQQNLSREINTIKPNIDTMFKRQASILDSYDISYGKLNSKKLTVPVTITITPKQYFETSLASLLVNDNEVAMTKKGANFYVTADINIFDNINLKVSLKQDTLIKTETIKENISLHSKYLLEIFGRFEGESSTRFIKDDEGNMVNNYTYNGDIFLDIKGAIENTQVKVDIIEEINGEITYQESYDAKDAKEIPVNRNINILPDDKLILYAVVKDNYGLNYKYILKFHDGENTNIFDEFIHINNVSEISDNDGNILYRRELELIK